MVENFFAVHVIQRLLCDSSQESARNSRNTQNHNNTEQAFKQKSSAKKSFKPTRKQWTIPLLDKRLNQENH